MKVAKKKQVKVKSEYRKIHFCSVRVSEQVHERLIRRKFNPNDSFAKVVERLLENDELSFKVQYNPAQLKHRKSIDIRKESSDKINELRIENRIKTINEVLWRVMANEKNR